MIDLSSDSRLRSHPLYSHCFLGMRRNYAAQKDAPASPRVKGQAVSIHRKCTKQSALRKLMHIAIFGCFRYSIFYSRWVDEMVSRTAEKIAGALSLAVGGALLILWFNHPREAVLIKTKEISSEMYELEAEKELTSPNTYRLASADPEPALRVIQTNLAIEYTEQVPRGSAAHVTVRVSQERRIKSLSERPRPDRVFPIDRLEWPINLTLNVHGRSEAKTLGKGSPLPAKLIWVPAIDPELTNVVAILSVRHDIGNNPKLEKAARQNVASTQTKVSVNDQGSAVSGTADDVPLEISFTKFGLPAWLWEYVTLGGSVLSFIFGCAFLTGIASRVWSRLFGHPRAANYT
ncbi:hypothetical protein QA649_08930 [Bradyrhizobium sp. CB1717]|uniref:hypothetical protein n=1 Tax=Bradyrhizobium sp. CB1717 TaxID=3039154 RepID=UPI0024B0BF0A|nr:hypothetical protein [Bradyrhizobium sp. CB1717]WFU26314.1 hypothetical protein QA649_08930 [Bradyrhizobium sp. CB1717]